MSLKIDLKKELKSLFGFSKFKGNQEQIISSLIKGNNNLVIMPTGAGKSLCFQLPAIIREGTTLVVSPLIALQEEQVKKLNALGIPAFAINSRLTEEEKMHGDPFLVEMVKIAPKSERGHARNRK